MGAGGVLEPAPLLESTVRRLDLLAARRQHDSRLPSLADGVFRDGHEVWSRAIGALSYDAAGSPGIAATVTDSHRIGSITKSFTAVLVLQLRDEGRLDLTDALADHLTVDDATTRELREAFGRVRLLDLLAHRGGLAREPEAGFWWERNAGQAAAEFLADRGAGDVRTAGGAGHHYSNLGYGLLGAVVEHHRHHPWREVLAARILDPLGLTRTGCKPLTAAPQGYSVHPWADELMPEPTPDTGAMAPAGQLWSTLADLGRWGSFLADPATVDPGSVVLAPASVTLMRTSRGPALEGEQHDVDGYGLGLDVWWRGGRFLIGHGGSMPGHLAGLAFHPDSRAVAVSFASSYNTHSGAGHARDLLTALLDAEPSEPRPWRPGAPHPVVRPLLGPWWWGHVAFQITATAADPGQLWLTELSDPDAASRFVPVDDSTWLGISGEQTGELLTVRRDATGEPVELVLSSYRLGRGPYAVLPG